MLSKRPPSHRILTFCAMFEEKNRVRGGGPNLLAIRVAFGGLSFCILSKEDSFYACHAQT